MSSITTFGAFTMARLGIYASQKRLDITGNNIANINTKGYSRQTIEQKALVLGGADRTHSVKDSKTGHGTIVTGTSQLRDPYLDIRYRNEQSSVGAMDAKLYGLEQIASVLDEVGGGEEGEGVLEAQFNNLMQQMQNLVTQGAGRDEADTLVREAASSLVNTFHEYATRLETLRENQETVLAGDVDKVNGILKSIAELNSSIRKSNIYGADALEQKDERNLLIDELSKYMKISVTTEKEDLGDGLLVDKLVIKLANDDEIPEHAAVNKATLVDGVYSAQFSIKSGLKVINGHYVDMDGNPIEDTYADRDSGRVLYENGNAYIMTMEQTTLEPGGPKPPMKTAKCYVEYGTGFAVSADCPKPDENGFVTFNKDINIMMENGKPKYTDCYEAIPGTSMEDRRALLKKQLTYNEAKEVTCEKDDKGSYVNTDRGKVYIALENGKPKTDKYLVNTSGDAIDVKYSAYENDNSIVKTDKTNPYVSVPYTKIQIEKESDGSFKQEEFYVTNNGVPISGVAVDDKNVHYYSNGEPYVKVDGSHRGYDKNGNMYYFYGNQSIASDGKLPPPKTEGGSYVTADGKKIPTTGNKVYYNDSGDPYVLTAGENSEKVQIATSYSSNYDMILSELKDTKGRLLEDKYAKSMGTIKADADITDADKALAKFKNDNKDRLLEDTVTNDGKKEVYEYKAVAQKSKDANGKETITGWNIIRTKTVTSEKIELYDNTLYGALQAERELLTEQGEYSTAEQIAADTNATAKFGYPYYQHALDSLANKFAELMNNANQTVKDAKLSVTKDGYYKIPSEDALTEKIKNLSDEKGNPILKLDENGKPIPVVDENDNPVVDDDGNPQYEHISSIKDLGLKASDGSIIETYAQLKAEMKVGGSLTEVQRQVLYPKEDGGFFLGIYDEVKGGNLISNNFNGNDDHNPKVTANNISIASDWFKGDVRIITSTEFEAGSTANDNLSHLLSQFMNGEFEFKTQDVYDDAATNSTFYKGSLQGMLTNTWEIMANDQNTTNEMLQNYTTASDELYVNRDSVMGVDLNDEAMNMMQYQKSYSAACRFMTTIDELLDKLINGTGRAGL